jgi:hypothetical protein
MVFTPFAARTRVEGVATPIVRMTRYNILWFHSQQGPSPHLRVTTKNTASMPTRNSKITSKPRDRLILAFIARYSASYVSY